MNSKITVLLGKSVDFFNNFVCTLILTYKVAAVLACKASKKDHFVTEAMTSDDVELVSRAQYIAIQMVKNRDLLWTT